MLPYLNKTVDAIYDSVDSGTWKIVSDPIEGEVDYGLTESGPYSLINLTDNSTGVSNPPAPQYYGIWERDTRSIIPN